MTTDPSSCRSLATRSAPRERAPADSSAARPCGSERVVRAARGARRGVAPRSSGGLSDRRGAGARLPLRSTHAVQVEEELERPPRAVRVAKLEAAVEVEFQEVDGLLDLGLLGERRAVDRDRAGFERGFV